MIIIVKGGAKNEHKRVNSGLGAQRTRAAQVLDHHLIISSSPPPHHHPIIIPVIVFISFSFFHGHLLYLHYNHH